MNDAKTYSDDKKEHKRIMKKLEDEKMRVRELLKDELGIRIGIVSGELGKAPKCKNTLNKVYFITLCLYIVQHLVLVGQQVKGCHRAGEGA